MTGSTAEQQGARPGVASRSVDPGAEAESVNGRSAVTLADVDSEQARRFIAENHRAVLATMRSDGRVQLSPVTAGVDGEGYVVVSSRETAMKTRNVRRRPYAAICVFTEQFFGDWVQVEGDIEVVSLPDAMDGLVEYYRQIAGEHPDWDDYRAAMAEDRRVLLRMTVRRAGPNRSG